MTIARFRSVLKKSGLRKNDAEWFPRWLDQYRRFLKASGGDLAVERDAVIAFLRHIKAQGKAAWQRCQAVRAIEMYRDRVLNSREPDLSDIRDTLSDAARREQGANRKEEPREVGIIDRTEPQAIQQMRRELRLLHYSPRTEKAYAGWVARFLKWLGSDNVGDAGENEVKEFLSDLAVEPAVPFV